MATDPDSILLLPSPRKIQRHPGLSSVSVHTTIDPSVARPQGYVLLLTPAKARLVAHDDAGVRHGRQTLDQLHRQFGQTLPCLEIEDWPDFPVRGVMLDISRDKVPLLSTLLSFVDLLASWKINHLQLYVEHTFAYRGHHEVWQDASPVTPGEIRQLDAHCKSRGIELVPNQNSFGHMERWLKHPRYRPLAEAPDGATTPSGAPWPGPGTLCPTDPNSLALLADLYDQLLPNFTSPLFNVGCDETFELGQGRCKAECQQRGVHRVYLDFLNRIHQLVSRHGRRMMFWGDIILHEPALIGEIPDSAIALNWGYEADHPFDLQTRLFEESNVPFYICPGTSSWCSIAGRTDNMLANQLSAAAAGLRHRAIGYLNTDWGDYGHLQYLPVSYAGLAAGAAMSWCLESNGDLPLARALDRHAFGDSAGVMGRLAYDLGNVYQSVGRLLPNRSALFSLLVPSSSKAELSPPLSLDALAAAEAAVVAAMGELQRARMDRPDADLIKDEFQSAAAMLLRACSRGRLVLEPCERTRGELAEQLPLILASHRRCWLARNRPGGLTDSLARLA